MKNSYVILTGSKNNAGDYLIKHRAKELFAKLRQDREIIDFDAWIPFTNEQLQVVNQSKALILMGGPSLRQDMRDNYPMLDNLDYITVPIITMGVGWKALSTTWDDVYKYDFSFDTKKLLYRINNSGYISSVRDYHSLGVLLKDNYTNFLMTGCPALYNSEFINRPFVFQGEPNNISYSLGVSFVDNTSMEASMKENILSLVSMFKGKNFNVVFHHSLSEDYYKTSNQSLLFHNKHLEMKDWLIEKGINVVEISGSAENLINHYRKCDLHIGYRVHAHIFMNSESRPSILISEDGRGVALFNVISGLIFNGYSVKNDFLKLADSKGGASVKILNKLYKTIAPKTVKGFYMNSTEYLSSLLTSTIQYEIKNAFPRVSVSRLAIDSHFEQMKRFMAQLP